MEWIELSQDRIQRWANEMNFVIPEWRQPASQVLCFMELISFTVTSGTNVKLLAVLLNAFPLVMRKVSYAITNS
jgi:hypothetical protein